jgi:uncharacterized membrane protein
MAKKEATDDTQKKKKKNKLRFKTKLMLFISLIGSIFLFQQSTVLLLIGLLPAFVALIVDTTATKSWTKTVFCFNLAGIMPTMAEIAFTSTGSALQSRISDMNMWLMAYSAAGAAWLFIWLGPHIAHAWLSVYAKQSIDHHLAKMKQIDVEWNISRK